LPEDPRPAVGEITLLLEAWGRGDRDAFDRAYALVYAELRALARRQLWGRPPGGTLTPTALVHEAYLKLVDRTRAAVNDRRHFLALAGRAMRQIAVDCARQRAAGKRGGGLANLALDEGLLPVEERAREVLALDEALTRLELLDPRLGHTVELRFFGGLSVEETAEVLESSPRTVKRDWQKARAFLFQALQAKGA